MVKLVKEKRGGGTSLAVQWLTLHVSNAGDVGLIPGWRTKMPHAARCGQKKKIEQKYNWSIIYEEAVILISNLGN